VQKYYFFLNCKEKIIFLWKKISIFEKFSIFVPSKVGDGESANREESTDNQQNYNIKE